MAKLIEKRKQEFIERLRPYVEKYGRDLCNEFYFYWTEPNKSGKRMRFEAETFFEMGRRLGTWRKNVKEKYDKNLLRPGQSSPEYKKVAMRDGSIKLIPK